jgi:hypothetical protein
VKNELRPRTDLRTDLITRRCVIARIACVCVSQRKKISHLPIFTGEDHKVPVIRHQAPVQQAKGMTSVGLEQNSLKGQIVRIGVITALSQPLVTWA